MLSDNKVGVCVFVSTCFTLNRVNIKTNTFAGHFSAAYRLVVYAMLCMKGPFPIYSYPACYIGHEYLCTKILCCQIELFLPKSLPWKSQVVVLGVQGTFVHLYQCLSFILSLSFQREPWPNGTALAWHARGAEFESPRDQNFVLVPSVLSSKLLSNACHSLQSFRAIVAKQGLKTLYIFFQVFYLTNYLNKF